jgi:hypothetical protein
VYEEEPMRAAGPFCTIVSTSFVPFARVLASSLARHQDGRRLVALVMDDEGRLDPEREPFTIVRPDDLDHVLPSAEFGRMAVMYASKELATALKPFLLLHLLDEGAPVALFIDPDIEVFAPLDDVVEATAAHGVVLVPHSLAPIPLDGETPTETTIQRYGIFNGGFLGVSRAGRPFLLWLAERLLRDCISAPDQGLFVDQRWLDFVPAYFDHLVLRDPTLDVAYWNLHERDVVWADGRYKVGGRPLRFYHFSGYDPTRPDVLTTGSSRITFARRPNLRRLFDEYAEQLLAAGYADWRPLPFRYNTDGEGRTLEGDRRRLFRAVVKEREAAGAALPMSDLEPLSLATWANSDALERSASSAALAEYYLNRRPTLETQRLPRLVSAIRRALFRLNRPYQERDDLVLRTLLRALRDGDQGLAGRLAALEERLPDPR